jgi:hypothetical protein
VTVTAQRTAAAHATRTWIEPVGRVGIAAKGIVYLTIGLVAARVAIRHHGRLADRQKALVDIAGQPLGKAILLVVALGLCGYVVWRVVEALADPWRKDSSPTGIVRRAASLAIAVGYGGFAVSALRLALGGERPHGELAQSRAWTADLLHLPGGPWLLGAIGAGVAVFGLVEVFRGLSGSFLRVFKERRVWIARIGRVGLAARGVVFTILGGFVIAAACLEDAHEVKGLDGALRALDRAGGGWVLALAGAGLAAYGVYMFCEARYRDFGAPA